MVLCEGCELKRPTHGFLKDKLKRWCHPCAARLGHMSIKKQGTPREAVWLGPPDQMLDATVLEACNSDPTINISQLIVDYVSGGGHHLRKLVLAHQYELKDSAAGIDAIFEFMRKEKLRVSDAFARADVDACAARRCRPLLLSHLV